MIKIDLMLGDCTKLMRRIPPASIDMVLTSPPYDNLRDYDGSLEWHFDIFRLIAGGLKRVLKPGGVIVWVVGDATIKGSETGSSFKQALYFKEIGLNLHDTMIYLKDSCPWPAPLRYYPIFEYMFIFSNGPPKTFNPIKDRKNKWAGRKKIQGVEYDRGGSKRVRSRTPYVIQEYGTRYNAWKYSTGCGKTTADNSARTHPAMFPEKLAADHILSWSNEGDLILDPMMGSGTTGKVAKMLKRNFIGHEKVEKYFIAAKQRINCQQLEF